MDLRCSPWRRRTVFRRMAWTPPPAVGPPSRLLRYTRRTGGGGRALSATRSGPPAAYRRARRRRPPRRRTRPKRALPANPRDGNHLDLGRRPGRKDRSQRPRPLPCPGLGALRLIQRAPLAAPRGRTFLRDGTLPEPPSVAPPHSATLRLDRRPPARARSEAQHHRASPHPQRLHPHRQPPRVPPPRPDTTAPRLATRAFAPAGIRALASALGPGAVATYAYLALVGTWSVGLMLDRAAGGGRLPALYAIPAFLASG